MLHEIILSLSGHPSALFSSVHEQGSQSKSAPFPLLSAPETQLLSSIGRLSHLHAQVRAHASSIAASHPSAICRAVATSIASHHLENFQRKVEDVERQMLKRNSTVVGAYNIVPLAGIVSEFSGWMRLMEWLWSIANFMAPAPESNANGTKTTPASGAEIISKLRTEAQTGYPDIESAAMYLGKVAEASWLRQLSGWALYGRLPSFGAEDFFIHPAPEGSEEGLFVTDSKLLPNFVSRQTAASILFIGKSLHQIRTFGTGSRESTRSPKVKSSLDMLPSHVEHLAEVLPPVSSAKLSEAIANIRLSLSKNLLQQLLPIEKILELLMVLQDFFLLGRGEFAVALIAEADKQIRSRNQAAPQSQRSQSLQHVLLKEGEIAGVLSRSWSILSSLIGDDSRTDDLLDLATKVIHLEPCAFSTHRPGTPGRAKEATSILPDIKNSMFTDFLFPAPTQLTVDISSPFDLFFSNADLDIYSVINAYLISLRRAHIHLAQLWSQSSIRKEHPAPPGPQYSSSSHGKVLLRRKRHRFEARSREMRKVWATCSAAVFFLSESEAYFQGEVIQESWRTFRDWVTGLEVEEHSHGSQTTTFTNRDEPNQSATTKTSSSAHPTTATQERTEHHDPETVAFAHKRFLAALAYSLLLTDTTFTAAMRQLFKHVDELVAFTNRLQVIQSNLDLEEDDGVEDSLTNYKQEEKQVSLGLDRARKRLDSDMKTIITRLRDIDTERVGSPSVFSAPSGGSSFEPLRVGGVDRLLMKLDWHGLADDEESG